MRLYVARAVTPAGQEQARRSAGSLAADLDEARAAAAAMQQRLSDLASNVQLAGLAAATEELQGRAKDSADGLEQLKVGGRALLGGRGGGGGVCARHTGREGRVG